MEITLTPETEEVVRQKLANGSFASAADVIEAAVRLLDARDRYEYLRGLILEAEREVQEGNVVEWTPELHRQWRREAEEGAYEDVPPDPDVCP